MKQSSFNRSGFASLDDLETEDFLVYFEEMNKFQNYFLSFENSFRSQEYKWPRDPLHTWSRCWEYPYVLHNIRKWKKLISPDNPRVMDYGSGVTFFPFLLAQENLNVVCVDNDDTVRKDIEKVIKTIPHNKGTISFHLTDGSSTPFRDDYFDAIYCISVLEHVSEPDRIITEIHRVLKEKGLFILTFDINLSEKNFEKYDNLICTLKECFTLKEPEISIHPLRVLNSNNSLFPYSNSLGQINILERIKNCLFWIFRKYQIIICQGFIFEKK